MSSSDPAVQDQQDSDPQHPVTNTFRELADSLEQRVTRLTGIKRPKAVLVPYEGTASEDYVVIHGSHDSLAPVEEARQFVRLLRRTSRAPVACAELPGAQHAFEIFHGLRKRHVVEGVDRFLAWVYPRYLDELEPAAPAAEPG